MCICVCVCISTNIVSSNSLTVAGYVQYWGIASYSARVHLPPGPPHSYFYITVCTLILVEEIEAEHGCLS